MWGRPLLLAPCSFLPARAAPFHAIPPRRRGVTCDPMRRSEVHPEYADTRAQILGTCTSGVFPHSSGSPLLSSELPRLPRHHCFRPVSPPPLPRPRSQTFESGSRSCPIADLLTTPHSTSYHVHAMHTLVPLANPPTPGQTM
ncbi:hypothetical protein B0H15DRAFT_815522 [Mycena belliarum]|uniref:Secreted protein n=1 Tax=Mycena belliarum TaxID=1033014 RepID=A0AAD6XT23_9AGAR|nr:hypothetical protein B0H15DRAFT_815522 [Mycena belliae]